MWKRLTGLMVFALGMVGCSEQAPLTAPDVRPLFAATTTTTVERFDLDGASFFNPCNGDYVEAEVGFGIEVLHVTVNKNHVVLSAPLIVHWTGTSQETGIRYILNGSWPLTAKAPLVNGAATFTEAFSLVAVAQGQAPNFRVLFVNHLTVNANGEVTSSFELNADGCLG